MCAAINTACRLSPNRAGVDCRLPPADRLAKAPHVGQHSGGCLERVQAQLTPPLRLHQHPVLIPTQQQLPRQPRDRRRRSAEPIAPVTRPVRRTWGSRSATPRCSSSCSPASDVSRPARCTKRPAAPSGHPRTDREGHASGALEPGDPKSIGLLLFATMQGIAAHVTSDLELPSEARPSTCGRGAVGIGSVSKFKAGPAAAPTAIRGPTEEWSPRAPRSFWAHA
jgi:hypothetical protein